MCAQDAEELDLDWGEQVEQHEGWKLQPLALRLGADDGGEHLGHDAVRVHAEPHLPAAEHQPERGARLVGRPSEQSRLGRSGEMLFHRHHLYDFMTDVNMIKIDIIISDVSLNLSYEPIYIKCNLIY